MTRKDNLNYLSFFIQQINIKEKYPKGTKIKCIKLEDSFNPIPSGTVGIVEYVDDANQIHMNWENGSSLALIPDLDEFEVIERKPKHKSKGVER